MKNIIKTSIEFDKVDKYLLTRGSGNQNLKDLPDGTVINVRGYMIFEDVDESTGEVNKLCSIMDNDREVYTTQSATAMRTLEEIADVMSPDPYAVRKVSGTTKAGRGYVNLELAI